jgi:RNA polymerase sigma-70 factor (ECF subfamily)
VSAREVSDDTLPEVADRVDSGRSGIDTQAIRRALRSLPARQRDVIEGLKFRDQSVRDVAGRLGMSESAVKVTAHRGYRTLRRLLGGRDRED